MAELMLSTPMRIRPVGSDTIRDITTLKDASEILIDWPQARRDPFYQAAREQVEAALESSTGAGSVRRLLQPRRYPGSLMHIAQR